jgi:hypothetical protein
MGRIAVTVKLNAGSPVVRILRILKDVPEAERFDVLATVCAAFVQTNGTISNEAQPASRRTVLGSDRVVRDELSKARAVGKIGRKR